VNDWLVPIVRRIPNGPVAAKLIRARMAVRGADGAVYAAGVTKSKAAEEWLDAARAMLAALPSPPALRRPSAVLKYRVTVYVPSLASDGPNRGKLFEDALNELIIDDDRQFVEWGGTKDIDSKRPRIELEVALADPEQHPRVAERLALSEREARKKAAKAATAELFPEQQRPAAKAPAYRTPAPPGETWGKRHGLDKLRAKARPASYPNGRIPR
jgi:hypothetical protein